MSSYHATPMNQPKNPPMKKPAAAIITLSIIASQKAYLLRQPPSLRRLRHGVNQCAFAIPRKSMADDYSGDRKTDQSGDYSRSFIRTTAAALFETESNGEWYTDKKSYESTDGAKYRFFPAAWRS